MKIIKNIRWNEEKNVLLKEERGIGFETIFPSRKFTKLLKRGKA